MAKRPQPWLIRLTHWANIPVLGIMAMSGLRSSMAYPYMGPRGDRFAWWPLQGWMPKPWMRVGGWLAGARHWHFAFAWLLVFNAVVYLAYLVASGRALKRRYFWPPRDTIPALQQMAFYLRLRKDPPPVDLYNGLQRLAYTSALLLGTIEILSGLASAEARAAPAARRDLRRASATARVVHLVTLFLLVGFVITHVLMVALHPRSLGEMITGGKKHE